MARRQITDRNGRTQFPQKRKPPKEWGNAQLKKMKPPKEWGPALSKPQTQSLEEGERVQTLDENGKQTPWGAQIVSNDGKEGGIVVHFIGFNGSMYFVVLRRLSFSFFQNILFSKRVSDSQNKSSV